MAKQLIQVSYEAQPQVHVPMIFENECYVLSQQDIRRIEDTRYITYSKLGENGQLIPIENTSVVESRMPDPRLLEILTRARNHVFQPKTPSFQENRHEAHNAPLPMEIGLNNQLNPGLNRSPVASVEQQLNWSKKPNAQVQMFPMHRTVATETVKTDEGTASTKNYCNRGTTTITSAELPMKSTLRSCLCETGARSELKKLKVLNFCDGS